MSSDTGTTTYWRVWINPKNGQRYASFHVRKLNPVRHGTVAGYAAELRRKMVPCLACTEAMRIRGIERRAAGYNWRRAGQ